jgi:aryl-alcohol dehydrogenase-like predicted oxidoreductase
VNAEKIVLGTVQFGLNYGINNSVGKPDLSAVKEILNLASASGINELDTADAYGEASDVLRDILGQYPNRFKIMSKCSIEQSEDFLKMFHKSLIRLGQSHLEGYYFHRFADYKAFNNFEDVANLKSRGFIKYLAVSLYEIEELKIAAVDPHVDVIQLPLNILDCSSEKSELLKIARKNNKLIYTRSAFLQGLFFKKPNELPLKLHPLSSSLMLVQNLAKKYDMKMEELCLNFCCHLAFVDKVVIGVDTVEQLQSNLNLLKTVFPTELYEEIAQIKIADPRLLNPSSWSL